MRYYCEIVPFETAKKLKEAGFPQDECMEMDGYTKDGRLTNYSNQDIAAPIYAEVVDWFMENGIFIQMEPWHTFALQERMGFVYKINMVNEEGAKINTELWNDFASFKLCLNAAIERACQILNEK